MSRPGTGRPEGDAPAEVPAHPAATVVLLRDGPDGLEVLLARRSSKLDFHGGNWVFPGGRIDPGDFDDSGDIDLAARRAAVREALEEASLHVDEGSLVHLSNWTTPDILPKRFATWFFAGRVAGGEERADGGETEALRWFRPHEALAARAAGEIELAPPQYVTLLGLAEHADVPGALAAIDAAEPIDFVPRFHFLGEVHAVCVYGDDVAYDDRDLLDAPGPRHRLVMTAETWVYEWAD